MKRKTLLKIGFILVFVLINLANYACEVEMKILGDSTAKAYKEGDVIVVELTIINTHRDCREPIKDAKIMTDGCKVMAATPWKEYKAGAFTRKLKLVVLPGTDSVIQLVCKRSCDKDGGYGKLILGKRS